MRSTCYKAVLQDGDEKIFNEMLQLYRSTDLHEEQDRISRALGCIGNVNILRKVIDFAMSVSRLMFGGSYCYNYNIAIKFINVREKYVHRTQFLLLLL